MLHLRDETISFGSRLNNPGSIAWLYLSLEFLLGLGISLFLMVLKIIKSLLPKPPRDLTGDVVLVTGATSSLGTSLSEEFSRNGCSIICVDRNADNVEKLATELRKNYPGIEKISPRYGKNHQDETRAKKCNCFAYTCDFMNQSEIKELARKIQDEVGAIDILVTCVRDEDGQGAFDSVSRTLMSHYWTVLAFLPAMLHRERAHVIGVTPTLFVEEAQIGSKAVVTGLMESLREEFCGPNRQLTFITVAPKAEPSLLKQSEHEIAKEVVQAARRDLSFVKINRLSKFTYNLSCKMHDGITAISRWFEV